MEQNGYLGGILTRAAAERVPEWAENVIPGGPSRWSLFLRTEGDFLQRFSAQGVTVLLRGCAAAPGWASPGRLLQDLHWYYITHGELPLDRLEGAFTLLVLDGMRDRLLLYRNLAGAGSTYYTETAGGLIFASSLPRLLDALPAAPRANPDVLPAYFLFRYVPGRETLFRGIQRLVPGELICSDERGLTRTQRQTFGPWHAARPIGVDAVERLEHTMTEVLTDYARPRPDSVTLLSGGVDSSYLQAVWGRVRGDTGKSRTFAVAVDHPRTQADAQYARTAAAALDTDHTFVAADAPYRTYLLDLIASTGEPPNHVQSAYFGALARAMVRRGVTTGLCGEGADSLFGLGDADALSEARWLRRLVPTRLLRRWGKTLAGWLGLARLRQGLSLADRLGALTDFDHPVNRVAAFTHLPSVEGCFGRQAIGSALAYRRALLQRYEVPADPVYQLHLCGYLGEAVESAALWTTQFNEAGAELLCPFLDSRVLRLATAIEPRRRFVYRRPKDLLKQALARHLPPALVYRPKLGFGQPIFEWLAPGGQLRPLVESIGHHDFVHKETLARAAARPNWFLYSLLCYDLWHKVFIEQTLPRRRQGTTEPEPVAVGEREE
ncbi:MAG: asparagine synthase-related protein [Gemmataceae bacterium]|nr:asparagine synthase-related protein [Gemmataceae bacterium]